MKKVIFIFSFLLILFSCNKSPKVSLRFLDEYILADSTYVKGTLVGGLSGIDFNGKEYYLVSDNSEAPMFLKATITINQNKIEQINCTDVIKLNDTTEVFYKDNVLDLESIFIDNKEVYLVSEGSIIRGKAPTIFTTDFSGKLKDNYSIPDYFIPKLITKLKHNSAFEGSCKSMDSNGFWVATESPLIVDGEDPAVYKTSSPIRVTYFDKAAKKAIQQFPYELGSLEQPIKGSININGVTAILEYEKNKFFIIERNYQTGHGNKGLGVQIYEAIIDEETTNTLNLESLKEIPFVPAKKRLLLDFNDYKNKLTDRVIDNIEGITFGPKLPNGNHSLILVSDDNFQKYGKQLNQFILLEMVKK